MSCNTVSKITYYFCVVKCTNDIPENYLGAGNKAIGDCLRDEGSICVTPRTDEKGNVEFQCISGPGPSVSGKWTTLRTGGKQISHSIQ